MNDPDFELLRYRRCRDLHGNEINLTFGRRNGKPAVFFRPQIEVSHAAPEPQEFMGNPNEALAHKNHD
jgi:hypothetical protein